MTTPNLSVHNLSASTSVMPTAELTSPRNVWFWGPRLQLLADFLTIVLALSTLAWVFHAIAIQREFAHPQRLVFVIATAAATVALIFLYTNEQSQEVTPLNISETEALLRSVVFSFPLLVTVISFIGVSGKYVTLSAALALGLVMLQRSAGRVIRGRVLLRGHCLQHTATYANSDDSRSLTNLPEVPSLDCEYAVAVVDSADCSLDASDGGHPSAAVRPGQDNFTRERNGGKTRIAVSSLPEKGFAGNWPYRKRLILGLALLLESRVLSEGSVTHADDIGNPLNGNRQLPTFARGHGVAKRVTDVAFCIPCMVLSLPICLMTALAIKLDSCGPVFFHQDRVGQNGRLFRLWKFRSMHRDVPPYARSPLSDTDARLTRVGRVIRRFSIDELPQLINVLCGDMSLVGPRPEMPFIVEQYRPLERRRLIAQPGITGLWQISPARAQPIHENMGFDLYYVYRQNIFLDIAILLRTITAVLRGIGAA